jgi:photosystem II stability/assembly factor-like uncharacterized protein
MKNSGVYKTVDGGLSWLPVNSGLVNMQVESLLIDSQNPNILYAGTLGGIFNTEDGGESWFSVGEGIYLLMDTQDNSHLYARDENGIYETIDQGNNWTTKYILKKDCPNVIHSWAIHPAKGDMLFIGGGGTCAGMYQSSDGGGSWTLIGLEDKPNIDTLTIGLDEQINFSIYTYFAELAELYVSHDEGANWSYSFGWTCDILTSDLESPSVIYCGSNTALFVTHDKGNAWKIVPGTNSISYSTIHIDHPNGINRIITGGIDVSHQSYPNVKLIISEDGGISWIQRDIGVGATRAELKIDPMDSTKIYLAMYLGRIDNAGCILYHTLNSGKTWTPITSSWPSPSWCGPAFDGVNVIYLMDRGSMQKSWDGGETWLIEHKNRGHGHKTDAIENAKAFANRLPSYYRDDFYFEGSQSVSANPYVEGFVYDVGDLIYYSTDSGVSWHLSSGSEGSWDARLFYTDQSKMIYAIGRTHQSYSTDSGMTWQACGKNVITSKSDSRLALDLQGSRLYLASSGQGVMISTDKCQSWQASNNGLGNLFVNTVAIDPNNSDILYAGTDGGAYVSFDGGLTWGQVNDGLLGSNIVYSIAVDKDSNVYAATPYGIFKLESR